MQWQLPLCTLLLCGLCVGLLRALRSSSEIKLRTELHETPVEYLRWLSRPRVGGTKQRDWRVAVELIVGVNVRLQTL
jgi:hypothetical protein